MTRFTPITTETPWLRVEIDDADWEQDDPIALARAMEQLFVVRRFERERQILARLQQKDAVARPLAQPRSNDATRRAG